MAENFDRHYELIIGEPNLIGATGELNQSVKITGNNFRFSIKKTNDSTLNEMDLTVYNLSKETIAIFDKKDIRVELKVWYSTNPPVTLFAGEKTHCQTKRVVENIETNILASEGYLASREGRVQIAFPKLTNVEEIIKKVMQDGLGGSPVFSEGAKGLIKKVYDNGFSATGSAKVVLDKVCSSNGLTWDLGLNVFPINGNTDRKAIVLYPWHIKNSPEKVSQESRKLKEDLNAPKETGLRVTTTLNPLLLAGDLVKLEGTFNSDGTYLIETVSHSGEYEGEEWDTTIEVADYA
jgi:hypothetical protein